MNTSVEFIQTLYSLFTKRPFEDSNMHHLINSSIKGVLTDVLAKKSDIQITTVEDKQRESDAFATCESHEKGNQFENILTFRTDYTSIKELFINQLSRSINNSDKEATPESNYLRLEHILKLDSDEIERLMNTNVDMYTIYIYLYQQITGEIEPRLARLGTMSTELRSVKDELTKEYEAKLATFNDTVAKNKKELDLITAKYNELKVKHDELITKNARLSKTVKILVESNEMPKDSTTHILPITETLQHQAIQQAETQPTAIEEQVVEDELIVEEPAIEDDTTHQSTEASSNTEADTMPDSSDKAPSNNNEKLNVEKPVCSQRSVSTMNRARKNKKNKNKNQPFKFGIKP